MGYLRKSLTPKGGDILGYVSISNHAAPQESFSRSTKIGANAPGGLYCTQKGFYFRLDLVLDKMFTAHVRFKYWFGPH